MNRTNGSNQTNSTDFSSPANMTELTDRQRWELYSAWLDHADASIRANAVICLIHQANYLLDQQIAALESQFITEGGYREQLAAARLAERAKERDKNSSAAMPVQIPNCPQCGKLMAIRTAKQGQKAGQQFWGCTGYPDCKATSRV